MPVEAVKIPQNVQIEDKVVGPLSLRQIIIMTIGCGFSYMMYAAVQKSYGHVNIPLTVVLWIPAAISAAFALVNVNDLSLLRICFLLLERTQKPGIRTWGPRQGITITVRTSTFTTEGKEAAVPEGPRKPSASEQIAQLTSVVDQVEAGSKEKGTIVAEDSVSPGSSPVIQKAPVNPARIQVDSPAAVTPGVPSAPQSSDLSVFRDIFPPTA